MSFELLVTYVLYNCGTSWMLFRMGAKVAAISDSDIESDSDSTGGKSVIYLYY